MVILQVPDCSLLSRWNVPHCQTTGGVAARVIAKLTNDTELPERKNIETLINGSTNKWNYLTGKV